MGPALSPHRPAVPVEGPALQPGRLALGYCQLGREPAVKYWLKTYETLNLHFTKKTKKNIFNNMTTA